MTDTQRFCENCGSPLGEGLAFCESCGQAVPQEEPAPVAAGAGTPPTAEAAAAPPAPAATTPPPAATAATAPAAAGRTTGGSRWVQLVIGLVGVVVIVAAIVSSL